MDEAKELERIHNLRERLLKRAAIRRQIPDRKSVIEGKPDRIANILEEAAGTIEGLLNRLYKIEYR